MVRWIERQTGAARGKLGKGTGDNKIDVLPAIQMFLTEVRDDYCGVKAFFRYPLVSKLGLNVIAFFSRKRAALQLGIGSR